MSVTSFNDVSSAKYASKNIIKVYHQKNIIWQISFNKYSSFKSSNGKLLLFNMNNSGSIEELYINDVKQELPVHTLIRNPNNNTYESTGPAQIYNLTENINTIRIKGNFSLKGSNLNISDFKIGSKTTTTEAMFTECGGTLQFHEFKNNEANNGENIRNISNMFLNSTYTNLDITNLKINNSRDIEGMFDGCKSLTTLKGLNTLITNDVINMKNLFRNCESLLNLDVSNFNMKKVVNISGMFNNCKKITALSTNNWVGNEIKDISYLFSGCEELLSINISRLSFNKVEKINNLFENCKKLSNLQMPTISIDNITNISYVFFGCQSLNQTINIDNWIYDNVENMEGTFGDCPAFDTLNVSGWNISNVTNISKTFYNSKNPMFDLVTWDTHKIEKYEDCFKNVPISTEIWIDSDIFWNSTTNDMFTESDLGWLGVFSDVNTTFYVNALTDTEAINVVNLSSGSITKFRINRVDIAMPATKVITRDNANNYILPKGYNRISIQGQFSLYNIRY